MIHGRRDKRSRGGRVFLCRFLGVYLCQVTKRFDYGKEFF